MPESGRSDRHIGDPASPVGDRRGDGGGDAAHLLFADPQFEPRLLDRDLRPRRPADRAGRARADPCRRSALCGEGDDRVLWRRHPPGRRLSAQRPLSRRQPSARFDRLRAGVRGRQWRWRPRFWSINRAHQSDIGGATHGAYNAAATDIWQEGIRITPLRLYDRGEVRRDLLEMIATNVRHPRDFRGDLAAMIGSAHVGERRLLGIGGRIRLAAGQCGDRGGARRRRTPDPRGHRPMAGRRLPGRGIARRRRPRQQRHPHPRDGHQARQRSDDRSLRLARAGDELHQLVLPEHVFLGRRRAVLPDRPRHAKERRHLPPADGHRETGHGGVGQPRSAGHPGDQPLRAGDHRGDHQGIGAGLPRPRDGRLGPPLPHRHPGQGSAIR